MKTSRTSSEIKDTDKTVYPKCNMKKQHDKESLNLICLTKTCKFHGPICAMCKKEHTGHHVVPIKTFISNISETHKKMFLSLQKVQEEPTLQIEEKSNKKSSIQKLQESFNQIMGLLNFQVHELSEQIRKTQNRIIQEFQQAKAALQEDNFKGEAIGQCLQFLNGKQYTDHTDFRRNISQILRHINLGSKSEIVIQGKQEQIIKDYQEKTQVYKDNLMIVQTQIKQLYESLHQKSMKQKIEKPFFEDIRPKTAQISILKPQNVTFSPQFKAPNVKIQKLGKLAKLSDNLGNKVIFTQNAVSSKIHEITVKIVNVVGIISLGLGLKDKLRQKAFKFEKEAPNNGVYLISSNAFKWNTTQNNENGVSNSFTFSKNDEVVISLKLKDKKVVFTVKNDEKKKTQLSFKSLPEKRFLELQFCACLTVLGDQVQIV